MNHEKVELADGRLKGSVPFKKRSGYQRRARKKMVRVTRKPPVYTARPARISIVFTQPVSGSGHPSVFSVRAASAARF
jgi:hypothetical protein